MLLATVVSRRIPNSPSNPTKPISPHQPLDGLVDVALVVVIGAVVAIGLATGLAAGLTAAVATGLGAVDACAYCAEATVGVSTRLAITIAPATILAIDFFITKSPCIKKLAWLLTRTTRQPNGRQPLARQYERTHPKRLGNNNAVKAFTALVLLGLVAAMPPANNAPADSYFGRLKMSTLRIRYEITQLKGRYFNHKLLPEDVSHLASFASEAYYQWAARYPKDAWLASTGYNLAQLYEQLPGEDARTQAARALNFVRNHFKNTRYSKQAVAELTRGLPLHSYPAWAIAMRRTPTPSPAPSGSVAPRASASGSPAPKPSTMLRPGSTSSP